MYQNPALGPALGSARGPGPMGNAAQRFGKSHDGNLASYAKPRDATSAHMGKSHDGAIASLGNRQMPAVPAALTAQAIQKLQKISASQVPKLLLKTGLCHRHCCW